MAEFFAEYGLFLAKTITFVVALGVIIAMIATASAKRGKTGGHLEVTPLNERFEQMERALSAGILPKDVLKKQRKQEKLEAKQAKKQEKSKRKQKTKEETDAKSEATTEERKRLFVLDFKGDIKATAVGALREEITALLTIARDDDTVLLRLENAGGLVHEHGLAASQLLRLKQRKLNLIIAVDKVAASGGYMMACIADKIIAAPFAILGSIGVLAQIPNFYRLLDQHGINFEQIKGGEFKRTLTMFGKNTDEDRAKMQEEVEDTHALFREFVAEHRSGLDIHAVATGEHWYGTRALERQLVDELQTSDDYLLQAKDNIDIFQIEYQAKKDIGEKIASVMQLSVTAVIDRFLGLAQQRKMP